MAKPESKSKIIDSISSWLKLLALIVLSAEVVFSVALSTTSETDPYRSWYLPLMLVFLAIIVIGLFFERYMQITHSARLKHAAINAAGPPSSDVEEVSPEIIDSEEARWESDLSQANTIFSGIVTLDMTKVTSVPTFSR
jgi:hypothetical protein